MRPLPVLIVAGLLLPAFAAAQQPPPVSPLPAQAPSAPAPAAQAPAAPAPGQPQAEITPPPGSPTLLRAIEVRFSTQGNVSVIDPQTYVYYIQTQTSRPSAGVWMPYNEATEQSLLSDYKRLWSTSFLDNLTLSVEDRPYSNGVAAKYVVFDMEERQRVKIVDYDGSKKVEISKIDEALKEKNAVIRTDSFIDQGLVRRVSGIVRELYAEKGYQYAEVKPTIQAMAGGPKLIHLTFNITEGPKVEISDIDFVGNVKMSDGSLAKKMKENKGRGFFSFITGGGTYKEGKFEEDAEKVVEHYRNEGYIAAQVGQPELKVLEDSKDGKTRHIQLRVPVTEGARYRVGDFKFEGNTVVKEEALRPLFKMKTGDWYAEKRIRKGLEKAREIFGSGGYYEFVGFPDLKPRDLASGNGSTNGKPNDGADGAANDQADGTPRPGAAPIVDVTMRMQPGKQVLRQPDHLHREHDDARQRHPARAAGIRRGRVQHRGAESERQAAEPARLLQVPGGRRCDRRPEDARCAGGRDQRGRRHAEARGAEPEPAHVRRGRVPVRGLLRPAVVPDVELPRTGRDADGSGAGWVARAQLPARVHRAVPVRSSDHARVSTSSPARSATSRSSRSSRPAATSCSASRSRTSRGCSSATATSRSRSRS